MVSSYIKYLLLVCTAPSSSEALLAVQLNEVNLRKEGIHAASISNDVHDFKKTTAAGPNASSQLRDPYANADVASGERERVHTALVRAMGSYNFDYNSSNDRPVDAWLYMAHRLGTKEKNMYIPLLLTLEEGLESIGANVRVVDRFDEAQMVEQIRKSVADTGKVPLVLGIAVVKYSAGKGDKIMRECAEAGAYTALYNTEPGWTGKVAGAAKALGAQEVWDYNMGNVLAYKPDGAFVARYVPPGYLTKVASVASHVNFGSSSRNESMLGFMGKFGWRPKETQDEIKRQFGDLFHYTNSVWTWDDYVQWVEQYPMQLNLHRTAEDLGLETFRLSMLLTFKACVISALSDPADMHLFEGIVRFAETKDLMDVFSKVTRRDTGVQDCQLTSSSEFQKRFHPKVILQNSGLMDAWHPGQAASTE